MSFQQYSQDKPLQMLELELTSKCILKCPECDRTREKGTYKITDLPLDLIKKRLQSDILKDVSIALSGNYGDPIYHRHFLEVLKYLKSQNCKKIEVETNGSGKNTNFWIKTTSILDSNDTITFSVDGLKDTNHIYRINSKWDSIQQAMEIVSKSKVQAEWKFIVFKHNQHQIEQAQKLSKSLNFSLFTIVKSSLFRRNCLNEKDIDPLQPDEKWHTYTHIHQKASKILPKCLINKRHYISVEGYYFPCCWVGRRPVNKHMFSEKEMSELSLHNYSLKDIFNSSVLKKLEKSWENISSAPKECIKKCGKASQAQQRSSYEKIYIQN